MTPVLTVVGWTLIHFVWQACAIAVPVAAVLRLMARRSAAARYLVACAGLGAMLVAPILTARVLFGANDISAFALDGGSSGAAIATVINSRAGSVGVVPALAPPATSVSWSMPDLDRVAPGVSVVWLACVALLLGRMAGGWLTVRRLHRSALVADASPWQMACRRIAFRLG